MLTRASRGFATTLSPRASSSAFSGDGHRRDVGGREIVGRAQIQAGVDHGMHDDAAGIGLEGVAAEFEARTKLAGHDLDIRRVAAGPGPAERAFDGDACSPACASMAASMPL